LYTGAGYNFTSSVSNGVTINTGNSVTVTNYNGQAYTITINNDGNSEETFSCDFVDAGTGLGGLFPEKVINTGLTNAVSQYIKGEFLGNTGTDRDWSPPTTETGLLGTGAGFGGAAYTTGSTTAAVGAGDITPRFMKLVAGTYNLAGGDNGDAAAGTISSSAEKAALIGTAAAKTGVHALNNDALNISLAAIPGVTEQSVQNELVTLAEANKNFLAVVSPPMGLSSVQNAVDWHNGNGDGRDSSINSSYAACYWPWVKVFDVFSKTDLWLPPEAFAIAKMCDTDANADAWFAPAGVVRGRLTRPFDTELIINQGDRDTLYSGGNAVNPIVKFAQDGIVIFGQRTTQRTPSALDRVNVRRMMILVRKMILASTRQFAFEPNDAITWSRVRKVLVPMLQDIRDRRGITEFRVVCDDTTNTPVRIDRNELWCRVLIKPTKTAEIVVFEVNLTNQSADLG
jgi:phage tail sheath protein FI